MRSRSAVGILFLTVALLPPALMARGSAPNAPAHPPSTVPVAHPVDLNHATLDQLLNVPGMTRTWAERIIRFRPYRSKADLVEQGIVPGNVYRRIRDYVIAHRNKN